MVKKIVALVLISTMLFSIPAFSKTFYDVDNSGDFAHAVDVLSELGIISGMGDGSFQPNGLLTRAQFAKIAVHILGKEKSAVETTDAFSDVKNTDWYSGYVNTVAKDGYITGYPDGTFGANDFITYAQTVTVLVRLLGYNAEDVGYKWPQGYMEKAQVLGITDGMSLSDNSHITRKDAAILIYRTIFTHMKNTKTDLVTKMDHTVYEDAVILATRKDNATLLVNQVQTDKGIFTHGEHYSFDSLKGFEGTFITNDENEIIVFEKSNELTCEEHTISAVFTQEGKEEVSLIMENGETVEINNKTTLYIDNGTYTAQKLAEGINSGSKIDLFIKDGAVKHAVVEEYKYEGPKTVMGNQTIDELFEIEDMSTLRVIRKGLLATAADISEFDVCYYSRKTNTLYAYCDRVTGVYENAYPMKSVVTEVTVSGNSYKIASKTAVNKLNESENAFKIGDRVTLLFGESGDVVDAVSLTEETVNSYGVITGFGKEISDETEDDEKGRTEFYITFMSTDGKEVKYQVEDNEYEDNIGDFGSIDFKNTYARVSFPEYVRAKGAADKDEKTFGTFSFATDFAILELEDKNENTANVSTLTIADIHDMELSKTDVLHIQTNKRGEVVVLYVNNVSGNRNTYGVLTSVPKDSNSGAYSFLSGADTYTITGSYASYKKGDCIYYYNGLNGRSIGVLKTVAKGSRISSYADNLVKMNGKSYQLAEDVLIYAGKTISDIKTISLSDALNLTGEITFHSERGAEKGGKIRIIRIFAK